MGVFSSVENVRQLLREHELTLGHRAVGGTAGATGTQRRCFGPSSHTSHHVPSVTPTEATHEVRYSLI